MWVRDALRRKLSTSGDASLLHRGIASELPRKGRKISRWCNRANINRAIFYCYGRRYIADRIRCRRNERSCVGTRKCIGRRSGDLPGSFPLFLSVVTAITRLRTVIDNAYLDLRGLLNAFGIRFPEQCSKHPASTKSYRLILFNLVQLTGSISKFAFHGDRRTIRYYC